MKKSVFLATLALAGLTYKAADAQIGVHIGVNFGTPVYSPAPVYNPEPVDDGQYQGDDDYYYLPDADAYYSVPEQVYYFMNGSRWVSAAYLPGRFHDLDWRYARHYEIRGPRPFLRHDYYRTRFNGFAGGNPNWRNYDNRFRNGNFGPGGGFDNNRGGYAQRQDDRFGRPDQGYNGGNRGGWGNRPGNNYPNQQPQYGNQQGGNYNGNRGNQPQQNGQYSNWGQGQGRPQQNQQGQSGGWNRGNDGQQNNGQGQGQYNRPDRDPNMGNQGQYGQPNRSRGDNPNGNQPQGGQNNQPGDNQNRPGRGFGEMRPHFADVNGPNYDRQNRSIRPGRF